MKDALILELERQLKLKDFKLNSLLEITTGINTNQSVDQLIMIYEFILKEQLGFEKFILFNKQDIWEPLIKTGFKGKVKQIDVERDLMRFKDITMIESSHLEMLNEFDVVIPVYHKEKPLAFLLIKGIKEENLRASRSLDSLNFIQTLTNIIVVAIENKRIAKQSLKQERIKKELEVAS